MVDSPIPETPEQIRELLAWTRGQSPTERDLRIGVSMGAPHFLILGYLTEECGIARTLVRDALVAIDWPEALAQLDKWAPEPPRGAA
jgi:hypothetical protein